MKLETALALVEAEGSPVRAGVHPLVTSGRLKWNDEIPNGIAIANEVTDLGEVDSRFHDSLPWHGADSSTVREILTRRAEVKP